MPDWVDEVVEFLGNLQNEDYALYRDIRIAINRIERNPPKRGIPTRDHYYMYTDPMRRFQICYEFVPRQNEPILIAKIEIL